MVKNANKNNACSQSDFLNNKCPSRMSYFFGKVCRKFKEINLGNMLLGILMVFSVVS